MTQDGGQQGWVFRVARLMAHAAACGKLVHVQPDACAPCQPSHWCQRDMPCQCPLTLPFHTVCSHCLFTRPVHRPAAAAPNPFNIPADEDIFRHREEDKLYNKQLRDIALQQSVAGKTTASSRMMV